MMSDEKMCPLTKMTCYGKECGWWHYGECAMVTLAQKAEDTANELYHIRKELENR